MSMPDELGVEVNTPNQSDKILLKTIDILGREARDKGFQLNIYDDGTVE